MERVESALRVTMPLVVMAIMGGVMACGPGPQTAAVGDATASALLKTKQTDQASLSEGFKKEVVAKAAADECFYGVGDPRNGPIGDCAAPGQPKVNQAYVWGLAFSGGNLWFGTAPNVHCLVLGGYLGLTDPITTDSYVCEFGASKMAQAYQLPPEIGDWRPPRIFISNTTTKELTEKTAAVTDAGLLGTTMGLRSAGTLGGVVFLGGPGLLGGVNVFAFDTATNTYLGSHNFPGYTNIRKWLVVDGVLYTGVATEIGEGRILRWNGGVDDPWNFEEVATVGSDAAELAFHEGRIFVATWPGELAGGGSTAGLFMSPEIPAGGFTAADMGTSWPKVWGAEDYEPDPVTAATYGGGALASYGGYLYWGTMHVPFLATEAHFGVYEGYYGSTGGPSTAQTAAALAGTQRAIAIFRGRNFATAPELQVAYGESALPAFSPASGWTLQPTKMSAPLYGPSGFGNFFNNYTWAMAVFENRLFVGTMDWSYLADGLLQSYAESSGQALPIELPPENFGADLWAFKSTKAGATPISQDGVGNYSSYGIRTTVSTTDALYLGMANPMNLMTSTTDSLPEGGWELIRVTK